MIVFCTSCWAENEATATRCSRCSADLTGGLDQKGYVDKLIHSLVSHPIHETRVRAAWILGNRREARAVPVLAEILASSGDGDFDLKKAAVTALGQIGDTRVIPALLKAAQSGALTVRVEAVIVLGEIGDIEIVEQLSAMAQSDVSKVVRREAEQAVRKLLARASTGPHAH